VITPLRRSGMAHVLKGSHSFTCTPRIHPPTESTISAFAFTDPRGMEGWVGLGWLVGPAADEDWQQRTTCYAAEYWSMAHHTWTCWM